MLLHRVGTYLLTWEKSLNNLKNIKFFGGQAALGEEPGFLVLDPT